MSHRRVVCTGLGIISPLGSTPEAFVDGLYAGRSAIRRWRFVEDDRVYAKVGGDLSDYDAEAGLDALRERIPEEAHRRARKIFRTAPFSTRLTILTAVAAWLDAGLPLGPDEGDPWRRGVLVGGHNLNENYLLRNQDVFRDEPDWIDSLSALLTLDTDHAGSVSEILGCRGAQYSVGGACASANVALKNAVDEIRHHEHDVVAVVGATLDFSPMGLHAMALMGAITFQSFNDTPAAASRPQNARFVGSCTCRRTPSWWLGPPWRWPCWVPRATTPCSATCWGCSDSSRPPTSSGSVRRHTSSREEGRTINASPR